MQTSLELLFDGPDENEVENEVVAPIAATIPEMQVKTVAKPAKADKKAPVITEVRTPDPAPLELVAAIVAAPKSAGGEVKAKRARVPKDLAAQYGEKTVVRPVTPPVEVEIAKKRLSKVERQARRDLIKPSDDLLQRLARANEISGRKPKSEPRGKGWKFVCGRCGVTAYFETPGGLCACGTIAVKE